MQAHFQMNRDHGRRGSTLVVVLALLALLSILGLSFVLFAGSEKTSAENFAAAAESKTRDRPRPTTSVLTRFASRRLLTGSLDSERNSALYGGRHTLLASLVGRDVHPHSGRGVNIIEMPSNSLRTGLPVVDQNYDGQPDAGAGQALLELNDSPSANNGSLPSRPAPDVDYTAPDINSAFLAFNGMTLDPYNRPVHVVIPSFARPQYHRQILTGSRASPLVNWETNPNTSRRVLRPHPQHRDYRPDGVLRISPQDPSGLRYVVSKFDANLLGLSGPFPFGHSEDFNFNGVLDPGEDLNDNGILDAEAHHGVWTLGRWQQSTYYRAGQWVLVSEDNNANGIFDNGETSLVSDQVLDRWYFRVERAGLSSNSSPPNFAAVQVGNVTSNGGTTPVFRRFARFLPRYEFDADPDGDGIKEAVWLDLDFPVQSLGNGKKVVPLFAFTVYDADGLINLNASGNTSGQLNLGGTPFGNGQFISRSNLGLSTSEINPLWALDARPTGDFPINERTPGEVFQDHISQFGHAPSNQMENANMEWWFLQKGLAVRQPGTGSVLSYVPGRHGELARLVSSLNSQSNNPQTYSQPGIAGTDDNLNRDEGEQAPPFDPTFLARARPFVHPLDFRGGGQSIIKQGSTWLPLRYSHPLPIHFAGPPGQIFHNFLQYQNYQAQPTQMTMGGTGATSIRWGQALQGMLMQGSQTTPMVDEQVESIVDDRNRQPSDQLFNASENFFLQASHGDIETTGIDSRLANLMPYNLKINRRADTIRRRLTTDSWDTRDFSRPFHGVVAALDRRRAWEFWQIPNATNRFGNPLYAFPPRFVGAGIGTVTDPFRPTLRKLLEVIANAAPLRRTDLTLVQRKLSLNHIVSTLDVVNGTNTQAPYNRPLTVHPLNPGTTIVPLTWNVNSRTNSNSPPYPPTSPTQREWWARYDRQQMARDIYVLLYTLCGGDDNVNYTTTNDHANTMTTGNNLDRLYTTAQVREMAQFAVNVVDALDRDNVMTRFEYDKNLGPTIDSMSMMNVRTGWNLDDNAWTNDGHTPLTSGAGYNPDYPDDSIERGVVYGVEAQQLTLSEFFAVRTHKITDPNANNIAYNHPATAHDDTEDRVFGYVELTNASPFDVVLAAGHWRIVIQPNIVAANPAQVRQLTLKANALVEAGTQFTIGSCGDDQNPQTGGRFLVDPDYQPGVTVNPNHVLIAPRIEVPGDYLDLILQAGGGGAASPFRISDGAGNDLTSTLGSLLLGTGPANPFSRGNLNVLVRLQRRAHPDRDTSDPLVDGPGVAASYDLDNPWVDVDRMVYARTQAEWEFDIEKADNDSSSMTETHRIRRELYYLRSRQRPQPFNRSGQAYTGSPGGSGARPWETVLTSNLPKITSIGTPNSNSPVNFDRWQPHFDRDFTSLVDLLSVPIYGPHELTNKLDPADPNYHSAGQAKFLNPDFPNNNDPSPRLDNRWTRLLNFLEIPTRSDRFLPAMLPGNRKYRVPGKINLNTIRHPEVLAALLDQRDACITQTGDPIRHLIDINGESSRDWWTQFIRSRDRYDPVSEFFLPGTGHGRPFRSLGLSRFGITGIEHTLLRSIPLDTNTTAGYVKRRLFELGTQDQHNNRSIDHHTRHRLLSRIAGNTTTRSNVFFVFMQVDWFEAHRDRTTGHVRIGAKLETADPQRSFFVVDRSRALEYLQPQHIPRNGTYNIGRVSEDLNNNGVLDPGEDLNSNGTLDLVSTDSIDPEALILYQQTIE